MSGECEKSALGGINPCNVKPPVNTAACETLTSQIENFTLEFFGEIFKTEVDGVIQWSLPGRLDVGLVLNPRGATEPLGCYLLRLFEDGVVGAKGIKGDPGLPGCNGSTPYVQVLNGGFPQPPVGVTFPALVTRNRSILPGMDVFIEGSGWYEIVTSDGLGHVTLVLRKTVVNPGTFIPQGTVLLPSGKVGSTGGQGIQGIQGIKGFQGDKGIKGDTGDQGPAGDPSAVRLGTTQATIPTWQIQFPSNGTVDGYQGGIPTSGFVNVVLLPGSVPCTVNLPNPGTYLLLAHLGPGTTPLSVGGPGNPTAQQSQPGINYFRLKNISTNTVLPQSTTLTSRDTFLFAFATSLTPNNLIQVQAEALVGAGVISVHFLWAFKIS